MTPRTLPASTDREPTLLIGPAGFRTYTLWATAVTAALYTLGYGTVGFGLLFFGALWSLIRTGRLPWRRSPLDLPLAAFGAILLTSAAISPYRSLSLAVTLMLLISGAVYYGAFAWLLDRDPGSRAVVFYAWLSGAVAAVLVGLATSALHGGRAQVPRGVGPNGLGTTLLLGSLLSLGLAVRAPRGERWPYVAGGLVCLLGLLGSGSRAALAAWVAGAAYLAWRELGARPRRMAAVLGGGAVLLVAGLAATPLLVERIRNTVDDVSHNRVLIWQTSFAMIAARPLLGTGFGTFERAYQRVKGPDMAREPFAFNLWLNLAVETGILGFLAALSVAIAAIHTWWRGTPDAMTPVIAALWIGLLVDQFADNTLFSISTSAALWLLLALVAIPPGGVRGAVAGAVSSRQKASEPAVMPSPDPPDPRRVAVHRLMFALFVFGPTILFFSLPLVFLRLPLLVFLNGDLTTVVSAPIVARAVAVCAVWFAIAIGIVIWPARTDRAPRRDWAPPSSGGRPGALWPAFVALSVLGSAVSLFHLLHALPVWIEALAHQAIIAPPAGFVLGIYLLRRGDAVGWSGPRLAVVRTLLLLDLLVAVLVPVLLGTVAFAAFSTAAILYGLITSGVSWRWPAVVALLLVPFVLAALPVKEYLRQQFYGSDPFHRLGAAATPSVSSSPPIRMTFRQRLREFDPWMNGFRFHRVHGPLVLAQFGVARVVTRFNRLSDLAYVVQTTPASVPYARGVTYAPLVSKLVPRLVWPNKPRENAAQFYGHRYGYLDPPDTTHTVPLPMVTEGWVNAGWAGVVLSAVFFGLVLRVIWTYWIGAGGAPGNVLIGMAVLWTAVNGESNLSLVVGGMLYALLVYWIIAAAIGWWSRNRPRENCATPPAMVR